MLLSMNYTYLTIDIWTQRASTTVLCASVPSAQNGKHPVKLVSKVFNFTMDTPNWPESYATHAMSC